jgi:hypothetical protein
VSGKRKTPDAPPDWLQAYLARGFRLVFYPSNLKGPREKDWLTKTYGPDNYMGQNVGCLTGHEIAPGRYLVDIDFDWPDGLALAKRLLPNTAFSFGRQSRHVSHAFYTVSTPLVTRTFDDINEKPLVEMRGTKTDGSVGLQTMLPPSVHPTGEIITLRTDGEIAHEDTLPRRILCYAVGCLFLNHLGQRGLLHDTRLALAGFLLQSNFNEEETTVIAEAIAEATGNNVADVAPVVHTTVARLKRDEKVQGRTALAKALGEDGPKVLARIRSWTGDSDFVLDKKGEHVLHRSQENIRRAFEKLQVTLSYNTFAQKPMITYNGYTGPTQDMITNHLRLEIETQFKFLPEKDYYYDVLHNTAWKTQFHPVVQYLRSLVWDQVPRVDAWVIESAGAADNDYVRAVSGLVLLGAVKRVLQPGCKFDEMLVLESGTQGLDKSSALRALCPESDWFSDDLPLNLDAKEIIERTLGKWIIEASDLSGMSPRNVEHLKAMLSRQVDGPVRMAYGRLPVEAPRQFVIIGTTNSYEYLSDVTGNRRFWPVRINRFNKAWIIEHRDQLWAEAYARVMAGESIRLKEELYPIATLQQERRRSGDPWETVLEAALQARDPTGIYHDQWRIANDELWEIVGVSRDRQTNEGSRRLSSAMQLLGYRRMTVTNRDNQIVKGWGKGSGTRGLALVPKDEENV